MMTCFLPLILTSLTVGGKPVTFEQFEMIENICTIAVSDCDLARGENSDLKPFGYKLKYMDIRKTCWYGVSNG